MTGAEVRTRLRGAWGGTPGRVLRVVLGVLPLVWIARRVEVATVAHDAVAIGPLGLAAGFSMMLVSITAGTLRWQVLMRAYGARELPSFYALLRHAFVGFYFNVLPSGVAGDALRGVRVARYLPTPAASYTVVALERIAGLVGLLVLALAGALTGNELGDPLVAFAFRAAIGGGVALSALALAMPWVLARRPAWRAAVARIPVAGPIVAAIPPAQSSSGLVWAVVLSLVTQGTAVMAMVFLVGALLDGPTALACARVTPMAILVTYIPLTPGGIGQREFVYQYLFGLAGVRRETAVASSLLYFTLQLGLVAVGGLYHLVERAADAKAGEG